MTVNVHEAQTQLSQWLLRISMGEEVMIAKAGKRGARLTPCHEGVAGHVYL